MSDDERRLAGRVALVTGAGSGVGRGIALALARAGSTVALVGRRAEPLRNTASMIEAFGGEASAFPCDVASASETRRCVEEVAARFGGLDILVNAAHDVREGRLLDMTDDDFTVDWWSGFGGTLHLMQACFLHLQRSSGASIINIAAATSLKPDTSTFASYASTKEAIRSITRTAAMEWGVHGIRVNVLIPLARSEQFDQWGSDHPEAYRVILDSIPLGYLGDPATDVGPVAVFLAGDESRWITGSTLLADGGRGYLR